MSPSLLCCPCWSLIARTKRFPYLSLPCNWGSRCSLSFWVLIFQALARLINTFWDVFCCTPGLALLFLGPALLSFIPSLFCWIYLPPLGKLSQTPKDRYNGYSLKYRASIFYLYMYIHTYMHMI